ncbi:MAG: hypothetical protein ACLTZY_07585 [Alistipes indistinctus]
MEVSVWCKNAPRSFPSSDKAVQADPGVLDLIADATGRGTSARQSRKTARGRDETHYHGRRILLSDGTSIPKILPGSTSDGD